MELEQSNTADRSTSKWRNRIARIGRALSTGGYSEITPGYGVDTGSQPPFTRTELRAMPKLERIGHFLATGGYSEIVAPEPPREQ